MHSPHDSHLGNLPAILAAITLVAGASGCTDTPAQRALTPTAMTTAIGPGSTGAPSTASTAQTSPHEGEIFFAPTSVTPTGDPLVVRITYEGQGHGSHFGQFVEAGEYLLHSDVVGTPLFISNVVATRTVASGDQVFLANVTGVISLTGDPEHPLVLEGDFDYAGGTGRFAEVSGRMHWRAVGNPDGSALSHFDGAITTVGSQR